MPELSTVDLADFPTGIATEAEAGAAADAAVAAHDADLAAHPDLVVDINVATHAQIMIRNWFLG